MIDEKPPYEAATGAAAVILALYVLTLAPSTTFWDASEYIATGYTLGIPHPPGNALFVVLARVWAWTLGLVGTPPAVSINLLAAVTSAASFGFFFLVAHRVLRGLGQEKWVAMAGAGAAVLLGATTYTVWSQSNVNEKVYTVSGLVIAAVTWLVVLWNDRADKPGADRLLLWAGYWMLLGSTNHLMSVLPGLAVFAVILVRRWRVLLDINFLGRAVVLAFVGISFNLFLPIRAAQEPVINEGHVVCETATGAAVAVFTGGRRGCESLAYNLQRKQYGKPPLGVRMAPFSHQIHNYFQYLDWQWARSLDPNEPVSGKRLPFTLLYLSLACVGMVAVWRSDWRLGVLLGGLLATLTVALVYYLNFKYGFSLAEEVTNRAAHEVRERDYFFLGSISLIGILGGIGLGWLAGILFRKTGKKWVVPLVLAIAAVPLFLNWSWADRTGDYAARDWAFDLLNSVEPYGILFTNGDNDTFPLWYVQEVEGIRQDVTVAVVQYLFTDWYPKQIRELTKPGRQRQFVPVIPGLYEEVPLPEHSALVLPDEEIDRIVDGPVLEGFAVTVGNVSVEFPEEMYLGRGHRVALAMIATGGQERPVYFAGTGGEMATLGLAPWGVQHGLATRLHVRNLEASPRPGYHRGPGNFGGTWYDVPRTIQLVDEVYQYRGLQERDVWVDGASVNIPYQFYFLFASLGHIVNGELEDGENGQRYMAMSDDFLVVAQGGTEAQRDR